MGMDTVLVHHRLFPLPFAAKYLRVPPDWLRAECDAGRLPHLKAGDKVLVDLAKIEKLLWERAQKLVAANMEGGQ